MRWIGLAVFLVACDGGAGGPIDPVSGSWTYVATSTDEDSCGIVPLLGMDNGEFALVNHGDGTMTIDDGEWVFDCTLSGADFACPDRFPGGFETSGVEMAIEGEAHGVFGSSTEAEGTQTGTASCEDSDCNMAAAMMGMSPPCTATVRFAITLDD